MIIAMIILSTLGLYLSFILMREGTRRRVFVVFFGLAFVGSLALVYANDHMHFGMQRVTESKTQMIVSASPNKQLPLLLKQNVGTSGKDQVFIYKQTADGPRKHTKAAVNVTSQIRWSNAETATLTTNRTTWQYRHAFYRYLFMNQNNRLLITQQYVFTLPKTWYILTPEQAQAVAKQAKTMQGQSAQQRAIVEKAAAAAIKAAKQANPFLTAEQQQHIAADVRAKIQATVLDTMIKRAQADEQ